MERASILSEGTNITSDELFLDSRQKQKSISNMEKELIEEVLSSCDNELKASAKMLGMSDSTLEKKIKQYNL